MPLRKKNRKWHYRFQVDGRTWTGSTGLKATRLNKPEALRREVEAREMVIRGKNPNQRLVVKPFTEAAKEFLEWAAMEHREHPRTHRRLVTSFVSLKSFFGGRPVGAITDGAIENFKTGRRENEIKEITIRHDLYALSKFFQYALKQNWAAANPVRNVEMPSGTDAFRIHVLTDAEEQLYFHHATGDLYALGRLMLNQGCRPEELLLLRTEDVDLERRQMHIRRGKTAAARRTLTLTQESMHILAQRPDNSSQWFFPSPKHRGKPRVRLNSRHDAVLFRLNHFKDGDKWIEKPADQQIQFVLYDLRHTFATRLAQAGIDLPTIAAILGHSCLGVVQRYIHVTESHQRAAMICYEETLQEAQKGHANLGPISGRLWREEALNRVV